MLHNGCMKQLTPDPWSDTPATSERILDAIARIAGVLRSGTWQFATTEGLNPAQLDILDMLVSHKAGVRLSWIAQQLGVSTASASDSVSSLVQKGLLEKTKAADDGRAIALRLTNEGLIMAGKIAGATEFANNAIQQLSPAAQETTFTSLLNLIGKLQQSDRFPDIRACVTCTHFRPDYHTDNPAAPHHCALVNAPLRKEQLRLDCPEHQQATGNAIRSNWKRIEMR